MTIEERIKDRLKTILGHDYSERESEAAFAGARLAYIIAITDMSDELEKQRKLMFSNLLDQALHGD